MKIFSVTFLLYLLFLTGCSSNSTEPDPVGEGQISVTGDVTESYKVTALFGISTYSSDAMDKEYFSLLLFPNKEGSNPLAFTILYKSGPDLPATNSYTIGKYALGQDIPANHFGGGFSGLETEGFGGYSMTEGALTFKSVSESSLSGELNMSGHWAQGAEEDSTRTVTISGNFHAIPMPEE